MLFELRCVYIQSLYVSSDTRPLGNDSAAHTGSRSQRRLERDRADAEPRTLLLRGCESTGTRGSFMGPEVPIGDRKQDSGPSSRGSDCNSHG